MSARLLALPIVGLAASDSGSPALEAVYDVEDAFEGRERFRFTVAMADQAALADAAWDGGVPDGYSWHRAPETVSVPGVAIEACGGRARTDVEGALDDWLDTVGVHCPWGARLTRRAD